MKIRAKSRGRRDQGLRDVAVGYVVRILGTFSRGGVRIFVHDGGRGLDRPRHSADLQPLLCCTPRFRLLLRVAFSQIDLTNKPFIPTLVFHEALLSIRLASPSSATPTPYNTIRILYIKRRLIACE